MWHSKFMVWVEQKLIDLTSTIYIKRRETAPPVEQVAPTMEAAPAPAKTRTYVKRTEPKITKTTAITKKAKPAVKKAAPKKPAAKKPVAKKPAVKKPATKARTTKAK